MAPLTTAAGIVLTIIASVDAFAPVSTSHRHVVTSTSSLWRSYPSPITLQMSEEENADDTTATTVEEESTEQPEEPKLDPEIVALKESITSLESDLRAKKNQLRTVKENVDKYSSTGYARQVALVENNKRMRKGDNSDTTSAARATVMQTFLPVLEELDAVGAKYEGNDFAKSLDSGLSSAFKNSLGELGVVEYVVESGSKLDIGRVVAVEEEHSAEFAKGTVIRALKPGLEISGNVVRPAEVVGSLGEEKAGAGFAKEDGDASE